MEQGQGNCKAAIVPACGRHYLPSLDTAKPLPLLPQLVNGRPYSLGAGPLSGRRQRNGGITAEERRGWSSHFMNKGQGYRWDGGCNAMQAGGVVVRRCSKNAVRYAGSINRGGVTIYK